MCQHDVYKEGKTRAAGAYVRDCEKIRGERVEPRILQDERDVLRRGRKRDEDDQAKHIHRPEIVVA